MSIKVRTCDNVMFELSRKDAMKSDLFKEMIEDNEEPDDIIPLADITSDIFQIICDYLNHEDGGIPLNVPKQLRTQDFANISAIPEWQRELVKTLTIKQQHGLIRAAHFLLISPLVDLISISFATIIKRNDMKKLKELFKECRPQEDEL